MDTPKTQDEQDITAQRYDEGTQSVRSQSRPRLWRASEIDRELASDLPLASVLQWMREFLTSPNPQLGRKGPVCPFVAPSFKLDTIWLAEVAEENLCLETICAIITEYRDQFLAAEPTSGPDAIYKSFLVAFPSLAAVGEAGPALVDEVQRTLKKYFVERGLMLGEFHLRNESPGLRNPEFRPLRSPIPMLAIRHMVDSDLPFLLRDNYSAAERSSFLRSYLSRLSSALSPSKFEDVLDRLISAEIEIWTAKVRAGEISATAMLFPGRYDTEAQSADAMT